MYKLTEIMKDNYIFAVIRGKNEEDGYEIAKACIAGGIKNIELTFTTPNVRKVIKKVVEEYDKDNSVVVGAGTVMSVKMAVEAYNAGAQFLVSPHFSADIASYSKEKGIHYMPGCGTVTEIFTAMEAGSEIIKIFPGGQLGPSFIKNVHGPIPEVDLMPSGGVSIENIKNWKDSGAAAVGVGSALTREIEEKGYESVTKIAEQFILALKE